MLKANMTLLNSLIIITFSGCFTYVNAQESVSSYEKSLIHNSKTVKKSVSHQSPQSKYNLNQLSDELQKRGWTVDKDHDGSLILKPKKSASKLAAKHSKSIKQKADSNNSSFYTMQKQLRDKGWGVNKNADGSIFLYPPKKSVHQPIQKKPISLPVNNWQKAYDLSQNWIDSNSISAAAVGKIRKIINIYIVSIVSAKKPHTLLHQIAIRNHDGKVIPLN